MAQTETKTWQYEGKIVGLNDNGVKIDSFDGWLNYTQQAWRDEQWDAHEKGDRIKLGCVKGRDGRMWVKSIENLTEQTPPWEREAPAARTSRDESIIRQTCIKAAAEIVAGLAQRGYYQDTEDAPATALISTDMQAIAQDLERWVNRETEALEAVRA